MRKNIRRFGKYGLDVEDLPDPLVPKPLPFELPLRPVFTRIFRLPVVGVARDAQAPRRL